MKQILTIVTFFLALGMGAQSVGINKAFNKEIDDYLSHTVPTITVEQLQMKGLSSIHLLDAREKEEFDISTIPQAIHIGYDDFNIKTLDHLPKDAEIVIFCSIGFRSEKIGEKLKEAGFTKVKNLYGSIFAWANAGNKLCTPEGEETHKLHTYNRKWSKWVDNSEVKKVW